MKKLKPVPVLNGKNSLKDYLQGSSTGLDTGCFPKRNSYLPPMANIAPLKTSDVKSSRNDVIDAYNIGDYTSLKKRMSILDVPKLPIDPSRILFTHTNDGLSPISDTNIFKEK